MSRLTIPRYATVGQALSAIIAASYRPDDQALETAIRGLLKVRLTSKRARAQEV